MAAQWFEEMFGFAPYNEYRFNETSGEIKSYGTATDADPGHLDQSELGGSSVVYNQSGPSTDYKSMDFDGIVDGFLADQGVSFSGVMTTGSMVGCLRVNTTTDGSNGYILNGAIAGGATTWGITMNIATRIEYVYSAGGALYAYISREVWAFADGFHTFMFTSDGTADGMALFIDGRTTPEAVEDLIIVKTGTATGAEWFHETHGALIYTKVGDRWDGAANNHFDGDLAHTAVTDTILTGAQFKVYHDRIMGGADVPPFGGGGSSANPAIIQRVHRNARNGE